MFHQLVVEEGEYQMAVAGLKVRPCEGFGQGVVVLVLEHLQRVQNSEVLRVWRQD